MQIPQDAVLLRIFIGESDRWEHKPLYEAIVLKARELHLGGAHAGLTQIHLLALRFDLRDPGIDECLRIFQRLLRSKLALDQSLLPEQIPPRLLELYLVLNQRGLRRARLRLGLLERGFLRRAV